MNPFHKLAYWIRIFSPMFIVMILALIGLAVSLLALWGTEGWSLLGVVFFAPAALVLYVVDRIFKHFIENIKAQWLLQLFLLTMVSCVFYLDGST